MTAVEYVQALAVGHGWSAANYAQAYGDSEPVEAQAERVAAERYPDHVLAREAYEAGYLLGWERYNAGQWQDGTPVDDDEADR